MSRIAMIAAFVIAALALGYGSYRLYGIWAAPVPAILIGLAVWERARERQK